MQKLTSPEPLKLTTKFGTFNYAFTLSFSSATQYSITEGVVPVPEPGALGFAFLTGAGLACVVVARGRRMCLCEAKCRAPSLPEDGA